MTTRLQQEAAISLINYDSKAGDEFAVSTSEYNDMRYFREVADRLGQRVIYASAQTMRGFAKRGLIKWESSWRSGTATIIDLDALRQIANEEI